MHQTSCYRGDSNTLVTDIICGRETQHTRKHNDNNIKSSPRASSKVKSSAHVCHYITPPPVSR